MSRLVNQHCAHGYCIKVADIPALARSWVRGFVLNKICRLPAKVYGARVPYWNEVTPHLSKEVVRKVSARGNQSSKFEPGWASNRRLRTAFSQMVESKIRVGQSAPREILEVFTLAGYKCSPLLNQYRETGTDLEANSMPRSHQRTNAKSSARPTPAKATSNQAPQPENGNKASQQIAKVGEQHPLPHRGLDPIEEAKSSKALRPRHEANDLWVAHHGDMVGSRVRTREQLGLHSSGHPYKIGCPARLYVAGKKC